MILIVKVVLPSIVTGFVVKDNDNNTRFGLQVTSSLFNAKTNMVEVYFSLPEEFVKYVPEHIGETFNFLSIITLSNLLDVRFQGLPLLGFIHSIVM